MNEIGFIEIGIVGAVLLLLGLVLDAVFEGLFEGVLPESEWLSLPTVGAGMVAFGFGAAITRDQLGAPFVVAVLVGIVLAVAAAWLAVRGTRSAMGMHTDATPTSADLVGAQGRVVTPFSADQAGEIVVRLAGQPVKLSALASEDVDATDTFATGSDVVVVSVVSPTRVRVQSAERFWASR